MYLVAIAINDKAAEARGPWPCFSDPGLFFHGMRKQSLSVVQIFVVAGW